MSVNSKQTMGLVTTETVSTGLDHADSSEQVVHNLNSGATSSTTLTGSSTPPATKVYSDEIELAAGTATVDLTSMVGAFSASVDFTSAKIQQIYIKAHAANTSHIVVSQNVATPYFLLGLTGDTITLHPGSSVQFELGAGVLAAVGAGAKLVDFDSAGDADAKFDIHLVAGI